MSKNNCVKKLKEKLGDLANYIATGYYYRTEANSIEGVGWHRMWKKKSVEFNNPKLKATGFCYCEIQIIRHYLIQNIKTKEYHFVGSECIRRFQIEGGSGLKRVCIDCNKPNKCNSLRCKSCRKKCSYHDEYHDDNSECKMCESCHNVHSKSTTCIPFKPPQPKPLVKEDPLIVKFGKYYNIHIDTIDDDSYIQWLVCSDKCNDTMKEFIQKNLLMLTKIQFGKHKGKSFQWIRSERSGYYNWFKLNCDKPYIEYLV